MKRAKCSRTAPVRPRHADAACCLPWIVTGLAAVCAAGGASAQTNALARAGAGAQPTAAARASGSGARLARPVVAPRRFSINFTEAPVRQVLETLASYTRVEVLVTPGASGNISLTLRSRTADYAVRLAAATAGLTVVRVAGTYIVGPDAEVKQAASELGGAEMVGLRFMTPTEAVNALRRLVPHVTAQPHQNSVIVSGTARDVEEARNRLLSIDVAPELPPLPPPPKPETEVLTIRAADPAGTERVLRDAFPALKVTRQDRALVMVGAPADLEAAGHALQTLDVQAPLLAQAPEVFVYRLAYLNAALTVISLRAALPNLNITVGPEAAAPPAANFTPLSSVGGFGGSTGGGGGSSGAAGGGGSGGANGTGAPAQILSRPTRLILIGTKADIDVAKSLLEQTDVPQPIVRIEAAIVEVSTDAMKTLGIQWNLNNVGFSFMGALNDLRFGTLGNNSTGSTTGSTTFSGGSTGTTSTGGTTTSTTTGTTTGGTTTGGTTGTTTGTTTTIVPTFQAVLQALIQQSKARVLASPNISVIDNEDASIFIGQLLRFLGGVVVTANSGSVQDVESLPVGIALLIRPRIHPNGDVTLKVHPVISSVSSTVNNLPQTSSREADTTVRLQQGEELVIGGLDQTEITSSQQRVPILGDIPIIGELFRSRTREVRKTQIVILIRAFTVQTDPAAPRNFRKLLGSPDVEELRKSIEKGAGN